MQLHFIHQYLEVAVVTTRLELALVVVAVAWIIECWTSLKAAWQHSTLAAVTVAFIIYVTLLQ